VNTSERGVKMITNFEAVVLHEYKDQAGIPTVCVGHVIRPGDATLLADGVSLEDCMLLLHQDLGSAESEINTLVTVPLTQDQFDALVSWEFNTGALRVSTLLRVLNAGDYYAAASEFEKWNKRRDEKTGALVIDAGLVARRQAEASLFRQGIDHAAIPPAVWDDYVARTLAKMVELYAPSFSPSERETKPDVTG
jgi:lysozyme